MGSPQVTPINENWHAEGFIVSEANGRRSRSQGTLVTGQNIKAGTVLGQIAVGTASSAAFANNAANTGTMGAVTVSAGAKAGVYKLTMIEPAANAGAFIVEDPEGIEIGTGTVAVAFSAGGLAFTLADGATDFISGEGFNITVAAGSGKYTTFDPTAGDGSQNAVAISLNDTDATSADHPVAVFARDGEINKSELVWGANVTTDNQKTAALAQLAALGIIGR